MLDYYPGGSSFPLLVRQGSRKYFVKLRAGMSGEYALLNEWFANRLGHILGLNTRMPVWIRLSEELKYDHLYIEVRKLIEKSMGLNIAFEYVENAVPADLGCLPAAFAEMEEEVYLLDLFLLNTDRSTSNHNLLKTDRDEILVTDFDSCLLFPGMLRSTDLSADPRVLQCLRTHPFYRKIGPESLSRFITRMNGVDFRAIIEEIPEEVLDRPGGQVILKALNEKKERNWDLDDLLRKLEALTPETEEERNLRIKKNREKLEALVSSSAKKRIPEP